MTHLTIVQPDQVMNWAKEVGQVSDSYELHRVRRAHIKIHNAPRIKHPWSFKSPEILLTWIHVEWVSVDVYSVDSSEGEPVEAMWKADQRYDVDVYVSGVLANKKGDPSTFKRRVTWVHWNDTVTSPWPEWLRSYVNFETNAGPFRMSKIIK